MRPVFLVLMLCLGSVSALLAAEPQPVVFKVQLTWEAKGPNGESSTGSAVGQYSPSAAWGGYVGANERATAGATGNNKTSPATFFKEMGGFAGLRPGDRLQFMQSAYAGTGKTEKGCSFTSTDPGSGNVAAIERDEQGALLTFCAACLEPGDTEDKCGYTPFFALEFPARIQETLEKFAQFRLSAQELNTFKSLSKTNEVVLETEPAEWRIKVRATLVGQ